MRVTVAARGDDSDRVSQSRTCQPRAVSEPTSDAVPHSARAGRRTGFSRPLTVFAPAVPADVPRLAWVTATVFSGPVVPGGV